MASADDEIDDSTGVFKAGVDVNPTIFLSVAKDFRQQQRSDPKFKLISYKIGTPSTPGHIGEMKVAKRLEAILQNRQDCLVIHSYSNLTPAERDYIDEIDLVVLDKLQGPFIMEVKGIILTKSQDVIGSTLPNSDKFPYCPRATVLLAWRQIRLRWAQVEQVLLTDLAEVGQNYGLLTDTENESDLLNELLDWIELLDRLKSNCFSIHPVQDGCDYNNLNIQCGKDNCYCGNKEAVAVGDINSQTHPHVVVGDDNFDQLAIFISERILADLPPFVSDPTLLDNFYLFLLRSFYFGFVILRWMFELPPASKLLEVTKLMKAQLYKHEKDMAKDLVGGKGKDVQILTSEQQRLLQQAGRQFIAGPAGSGKTVILLLKAKQIIDDCFCRKDSSPNQLLIVFSTDGITNHVKELLENHYREMSRVYCNNDVQMPSFDQFAMVTTYTQLERIVDEIKLKMSRWIYKCRKFTHVLADECQDLNGPWYQLLETQLSYDPNNSQQCFWCFYDNQQILYDRIFDSDVLYSCNPVELTKVFRSTRGIFNLLSTFVHMDGISVPHNVLGQKVTLHDRLLPTEKNGGSFRDAAGILLDVISMLTTEDNLVGRSKNDVDHTFKPYEHKDIVVLGSWSDLLIKEFNESLKTNATGMEFVDGTVTYAQLKPNQIRVETVEEFRGLEGSVVIWFVPDVGWNAQNRYNFDGVFIDILSPQGVFYSAVTRATAHLVLITMKQSEELKKIFHKCGERKFTLANLNEEFPLVKLPNKGQLGYVERQKNANRRAWINTEFTHPTLNG